MGEYKVDDVVETKKGIGKIIEIDEKGNIMIETDDGRKINMIPREVIKLVE